MGQFSPRSRPRLRQSLLSGRLLAVLAEKSRHLRGDALETSGRLAAAAIRGAGQSAGVSIKRAWWPRRARVNECWSILRAEAVYDQCLRERVALKPGWRATCARADSNRGRLEGRPFVVPQGGGLAQFDLAQRPAFYRCPACGRRATRLYVPFSGWQPRCRRCWGLNYEEPIMELQAHRAVRRHAGSSCPRDDKCASGRTEAGGAGLATMPGDRFS